MSKEDIKLNKDGVAAGKLLTPKEYQEAYAKQQTAKRAAALKAKK